MKVSVEKLLNIEELDTRAIFQGVKYPWEVLKEIKSFILEYAKNLPSDFERIDEFVWVGKGTTIEKSVYTLSTFKAKFWRCQNAKD